MPMPDWQDQPANREYKRKLRDLQIPIPRWWPGRMNIEIVGGDLETGAVVAHLPVEGNPYSPECRPTARLVATPM
ncbi:hypothetical protein [Rhodococcus sp. BS-15]|uniref:hypothetical protein n=1 Tax=Rhodococcus sp. BS-15 TaxID=1304954 RepID=UPI0011AEB598|nr:hypothetical protein [Rhodococcus sp. BS-15]